MNIRTALFAVSALSSTILIMPAHAADGPKKERVTAWEASRQHNDSDMVTTGVARGRDRLNSATSTSSMDDVQITKIGAPSLGELYRNIPGIRSEASVGLANNSYTIRGLPMLSSGAKYIQLQEDGLPVMEFGDILGVTPDIFIRPDLMVAQVESIRGGSASTFASDAPGGVINLISKTGEEEGGSVRFSAGLDHEMYRTDFEYGGHLNDTLRFHVGGYYRTGEGIRKTGFNGNNGGQVKLNITKEFSGGYIRLNGKYLDERNIGFLQSPVRVTGTDSNPHYENLANYSVSNDSMTSNNMPPVAGFDRNNNLRTYDVRDGIRALAKSIGIDSKFTLGEWSLSARARYSDQSGGGGLNVPLAIFPAIVADAVVTHGAPSLPPGLTYASGPNKGQAINPLTLNGNGMLTLSSYYAMTVDSLNNATGDLRLSRVWEVGNGNLTTTAGLYKARQEMKFATNFIAYFQDVNGSNSAYVNVADALGNPLTQDGILSYFGPSFGNLKVYDVNYNITSPYGSLNYQVGKVAFGASVRWDNGSVKGTNRLNTPADLTAVDINNDSVISPTEQTFAIAPFANTTPVNYDYDYVSYSGSINYRVSEVFSTFVRYSKGARAGADRILMTPAMNPVTGGLVDKSAAYDPVKQAEVGFKYRHNGLFLNLTGFYAKVSETNTQVGPDPADPSRITLNLIKRSVRAYGGEFEGGIRSGPFSLTATATMTNAKFTAAENPALVGNKPRHQAKFIYQIMPQYDIDLFTVGVDIIGTTDSYAQDTNQLKMPAYTTVGAFLQVRPVDRVVVSLNVNNVFNTKAITDVSAASINDTLQSNGATFAQTLYGRNVTTSVRFYF